MRGQHRSRATSTTFPEGPQEVLHPVSAIKAPTPGLCCVFISITTHLPCQVAPNTNRKHLRCLLICDYCCVRLICEKADMIFFFFSTPPQPKVQWMKNQMIIGDDPKYRQICVQGICSLEIRRPGNFDGGVYSCKAMNDHGEATVSCKLEVKRKCV